MNEKAKAADQINFENEMVARYTIVFIKMMNNIKMFYQMKQKSYYQEYHKFYVIFRRENLHNLSLT